MKPILPLADRASAGRLLAGKLAYLRGTQPVVLALPRGGVPVAYEIARALGAELDLLIVRKLGAPGHSEFGIGAVVDGEHPRLVLNEEAMRTITPSREYIQQQLSQQLVELERRRRAYVGDSIKRDLSSRTVIIVDDGIATGSSITAAINAMRGRRPARLVLAVPVAPAQTIQKLAPMCDDIIVLATPDPFHSVGQYYRDFRQVEDREVVELLAAAKERKSQNA